jgi:hypothetical protein
VKHRFQPLSPKIATSALQALTTLIANAVRYQKPMEPEWTSVYEVMPAACIAARPSTKQQHPDTCHLSDLVDVAHLADGVTACRCHWWRVPC